jgi:hypothetical protein
MNRAIFKHAPKGHFHKSPPGYLIRLIERTFFDRPRKGSSRYIEFAELKNGHGVCCGIFVAGNE